MYRVNAEPRVVDETDTRILDADAAGAERGITLQTCWPILSAQVTQRMIVTGTFEGWVNKTDGTPEQLAETHDTTATRVGRRIQTVSERIDMPVSGVLACAPEPYGSYGTRSTCAARSANGANGGPTWPTR